MRADFHSLIEVPSDPGTFISTRERNRVGFRQSVFQGSAKDGGLLVPESFPRFSPEFFEQQLQDMRPPDIAALLLRGFIPEDEIDDDELRHMAETALNFPLPLEEIDGTTFILRLDRGPTASFKDIAARVLAQLMEKLCNIEKKHINLVVATSGDTGVAIADAFGGSKWITVTVLYPQGKVANIQEQQMLDVDHRYENVQSIPIVGSFDKAQDYSKILQSMRGVSRMRNAESQQKAIEDIQKKIRERVDEELSQEEILETARTVDALNLSSANSINIWRLLPQMTQYFSAYAELMRQKKIQPGQQIVFAVPSGNVGHLMAGIYAKEMGLPIKKFIAGTNANNIFANIIGASVVRHKGWKETSSPAMSVTDPSNVERLFDHAADKEGSASQTRPSLKFEDMKADIKKIQRGVDEFERRLKDAQAAQDEGQIRLIEAERDQFLAREKYHLGKYSVTPDMINYLRGLIWAEDIKNEEDIRQKIIEVHDEYGILIEPHGMIAHIATEMAREKHSDITENDVVVEFETAAPGKFPDKLGGIEVTNDHPRLEQLQLQEKLTTPEAITDIRSVAARIKALFEKQLAKKAA